MRAAAGLLGAGLVVLSCSALFPEQIDFSTTPGWSMGTSRAAVGDAYTFGWPLRDPGDIDQRLVAIEIVETRGLEIVGLGAHALGGGGSIGISDGWLPVGYAIETIEPGRAPPAAHARVEAAVGVRLIEPQGGLRGLRLTYDNGSTRVSELVDVAFYACSKECSDRDEVLAELGLLRE